MLFSVAGAPQLFRAGHVTELSSQPVGHRRWGRRMMARRADPLAQGQAVLPDRLRALSPGGPSLEKVMGVGRAVGGWERHPGPSWALATGI